MKLNFSCQSKSGSSKNVVREWAGGSSATSNLSAAHFVKQNTNLGGGSIRFAISFLVPRRGLEPPRLAAYAPQAYVFTNYTTWASGTTIPLFLLLSPLLFLL